MDQGIVVCPGLYSDVDGPVRQGILRLVAEQGNQLFRAHQDIFCLWEQQLPGGGQRYAASVPVEQRNTQFLLQL